MQCDITEDDEYEDECTYKPTDCIEDKPTLGDVTILVTIDNLNSEVPITLFEDDVEHNRIVLQDTLHTDSKTYRLGYNYYSAKAIYKYEIDGEIVTVNSINGDELEYNEEEYCDGTCYTEGSIKINVEL